MNKSKQLIFFGTEHFSLTALQALVKNGFNISAVVTKPDSKQGRGKLLTPSAVKVFAEKMQIPIVQHQDITDIEQNLTEYQTDFAVLSAFGRIIPSSMLATFSGGIINIHPSLLPKYRGASPIEQTILSGDNETGVSLIKLVKEMDAGPIYAQSQIELDGAETAPQLYETLGELGAKLLIESLPKIINGKLPPSQQDKSLISFAPMINKHDGHINWNNDASTIERQIRAYLGWPGSKTALSGVQMTITKAEIHEANGRPGEPFTHQNKFGIYCADQSIIIDELKPAGKRIMTSEEFLAGNKVI